MNIPGLAPAAIAPRGSLLPLPSVPEEDPWGDYDDVLDLNTPNQVASEFAAAQARLLARWAQLQAALSSAPASAPPSGGAQE